MVLPARAARRCDEVESDWLALLNSPARAFISEQASPKADYQWAYATLVALSRGGGGRRSRVAADGARV